MSRYCSSAVDHEANLNSAIRVGTRTESFGSAKLASCRKHFEGSGASNEELPTAWVAYG